MKKFALHFVAILGTLSSIATLISFTLDKEITGGESVWVPICVGIGILTISVLYALYQSHPKKSVELDITPNLKLTIQQANLLNQKGIIVIGFNEYFDTHVGDGIVSEKTLHGIFINTYFIPPHPFLLQL